jgi:hypothetical protein
MQQQNSLINSPPSPQMPYTATREQDNIIQFKEADINATESLAYNNFIPSPNWKNFIRYVG